MPIDKEYIIRLNGFDLGQLLDGLEVRARAWRDTSFYIVDRKPPDRALKQTGVTMKPSSSKTVDISRRSLLNSTYRFHCIYHIVVIIV